MQTETNPFGCFCPPNARYLILGSFPSKAHQTNPDYNWFYSNKTNQFWKIFEKIYKVELKTKTQKKALFGNLKIAITDIILKCQRINASSLDINLKSIIYNKKVIAKILAENKIQKIFFTSRYVEASFTKNFKNLTKKYPQIKLIYLPSPSTRYAGTKFAEKVKIYKKLLPPIPNNQTTPHKPGLWKGKVWISKDFNKLPTEIADAFGM